MIIQNIVITLLIFAVFYVLYLYYYKSTSSKLFDTHDATTPFTITPKNSGKGTSDNYTYSMWINIEDYGFNYGSPKAVMYREGSGVTNSVSPLIYLDSTANNLVIMTNSIGNGKTDTKQSAMCSIADVPIQTWFNLTITLNGSVLDVYYNGKLVKSCILFDNNLRAVPYKSGSNINFCQAPKGGTIDLPKEIKSGFQGQIANAIFLPNSINPEEAYNIYTSSSGEINRSIHLDYKIRGTLFRNGKEWGEADISI